MRDYLLEKICDLEKWMESRGKRIFNWPFAALGFLLLLALLILSNLVALAGLVAKLFQPKKIRAVEDIKTTCIELEEADQLDIIIQDTANVLVDFWAAWCGPCMLMKPALNAVAQRFDGELVIVFVDASNFPELAKKLSVTGLPSLFLYQDNVLIHRHAGALSQQYLMELIGEKFGLVEKNLRESVHSTSTN